LRLLVTGAGTCIGRAGAPAIWPILSIGIGIGILSWELRGSEKPSSRAALAAQARNDTGNLIRRDASVGERLYQHQLLLHSRVESSRREHWRSSRVGIGLITGKVLSTTIRTWNLRCKGCPWGWHVYRRWGWLEWQTLIHGWKLLGRIILRIWHFVQTILILALGTGGCGRGCGVLLAGHIGQRCQYRRRVGCGRGSSGGGARLLQSQGSLDI
jgi:hypothetical protein